MTGYPDSGSRSCEQTNTASRLAPANLRKACNTARVDKRWAANRETPSCLSV
jgi:hypothetical protein